MVTIKLIIGSTRPNRFGPQPAKWLFELAQARGDARYELVDLVDVNLPLLDESNIPSMGNYQQEHTKKWAAIVGAADGFVMIHPEYNHGISAAVKNAFDFLWAEWLYKPIAYVSYGAEGGGIRATEQLRTIAGAQRMYDIRDELMIANYQQYLDEQGKFTATELQTKIAHQMLDQLVFWAEKMKPAREELAEKAKKK